MTEYVLKSDKTTDYLIISEEVPLWTSSIIHATVWKSYNILRFLIKWYVTKKYTPVSFRRVVSLTENINSQKFTAKRG